MFNEERHSHPLCGKIPSLRSVVGLIHQYIRTECQHDDCDNFWNDHCQHAGHVTDDGQDLRQRYNLEAGGDQRYHFEDGHDVSNGLPDHHLEDYATRDHAEEDHIPISSRQGRRHKLEERGERDGLEVRHK